MSPRRIQGDIGTSHIRLRETRFITAIRSNKVLSAALDKSDWLRHDPPPVGRVGLWLLLQSGAITM